MLVVSQCEFLGRKSTYLVLVGFSDERLAQNQSNNDSISVFALWKGSVLFECNKNSDVSSINDKSLLGVDFVMSFA